jgi:hypothetical protein
MKFPIGAPTPKGVSPPQKQVRIEILGNPLKKKVLIRFSFAIEWTEFDPDTAIQFARHIIERAEQLKRMP